MDVHVRMSLKDHGGIQVGQITFDGATCITRFKDYRAFGIYIYLFYGKEIWNDFFCNVIWNMHEVALMHHMSCFNHCYNIKHDFSKSE